MKVLNFGSLNLDYTCLVPHIVGRGETITSTRMELYPGGKGLNQSVALAKAGACVYHAGQIGEDGGMLKQVCAESGVHTDYIRTSDVRSGNAIIQVDEEGNNCIVLFAGANRQIKRAFIEEVVGQFAEGDILLIQNEINELPYLVDCAYERGMQIIMNPSPLDRQVFDCDLKKVSMFLLNEVEGEQLTWETETQKILDKMCVLFPDAEIVLTLGSEGSVYCKGSSRVKQAAFPTEAVDTTGAGDTFTGYFIAEYFENGDVERALKLASMASSIAVSRKGASSAIPVRAEVEERLQ